MKRMFLSAVLTLVSANAFATNCKLEVNGKSVELKPIEHSKLYMLMGAQLNGFAASYENDGRKSTESIALAHEGGANTNSVYLEYSTAEMTVTLNANRSEGAVVKCYNEFAEVQPEAK